MTARGWLATSVLFLSLSLAATPQVPVLPEAPGKQIVLKLCGNCHGIAILFEPKRTREAWRKSVEQMAALGVDGSEEEFETVVSFLTRHFGKINVNRASASQLREVLDIPLPEAEAIARHRETNGEFRGFDDLKKVRGVDAGRIGERRDRILFR